MSDRLRRDKRRLRTRVRSLRDALPADERERSSAAIADAVLALPEVRRSVAAMVFSSFGSEVDTRAIVEELVGAGTRVVLPRVEGRDLLAIEYRPGDPLVVAAFGMSEPATSAVVDAADVDVAITPGLAFDRDGYRVGYGGGFYDRFFAGSRPDMAKVGICFSVQLVDAVPRGPLDVPVDVVVTEREVVRCR
jgi:5-formyltetrahydrofolate cyclo-ligase